MSKNVRYEAKENEIKVKHGLIRKIDKKYSPEEVLSKIYVSGKKDKYENFNGDLIHMNSLRYHVFAKGLKCMCGRPECNLVGQYFVKERAIQSLKYHFNLYAIDMDGNEVMMTKDHIFPKSKGGRDVLENLETMSKICNERKADKFPINE